MPDRMRIARRFTFAGTVLSTMVFTQACGGTGPSVAPTPAPTAQAASAPPSPSSTDRITPPPATDAAPEALQGNWSTLLRPGELVELSIRPTSYKIDRGGAGGLGHISVVGDEITFSRVSTCMGEGTYRWAIEGDTLTFTQVGPDPCPRQEVLLGYEYRRQGT